MLDQDHGAARIGEDQRAPAAKLASFEDAHILAAQHGEMAPAGIGDDVARSGRGNDAGAPAEIGDAWTSTAAAPGRRVVSDLPPVACDRTASGRGNARAARPAWTVTDSAGLS